MGVPGAPALSLDGVSRRFGAVQALAGVSFDVRPGEVHALVGQNGSGKSTLMKVAYGEIAPDEGSITIGGEGCTLTSPRDALGRGVAFVAQELPFVDSLTVGENLLLGQLPTRWGLLSTRHMATRARQLLERIGATVSVDEPMSGLEMDQRQVVAIARAIGSSPRVLILDEPTSALNEDQVNRLYAVVRRLREEGMAIVIISQRLRDVRNIGDRITVLRDGEVVARVDSETFDEDRIASLMVGDEGVDTRPAIVAAPRQIGDAVLEVENLALDGHTAIASMVIHRREIVGLAGFEGSGKGDVLRSLYGLRKRARGSVVRVGGQVLASHNPSAAARSGLGFVTGGRRDCLFFEETIESNLSVVEQARCSLRLQDRRRQREVGRQLIERLNIRPPVPDRQVRYLSGGNQQKVALGKWLTRDCRVLLLEDPTRGVDVVARRQLHDEIRELALAGAGVLISSSDIEELIELCDRVVVMNRGTAVSTFENHNLTEARVLAAAGGHV